MDAGTDTSPPRIDRSLLGGLPPTLEWCGGTDGVLRLLDQTRLPLSVEMLDCATVEQVWEAIRTLRVRGAPAIGVAAAYGLYLGVRPFRDFRAEDFLAKVRQVAAYLTACRPTAVNLAWAVQRCVSVAEQSVGREAPAPCEAILAEAHVMAAEDAESCLKIGQAGADLIPEGAGVLTHCNAGALATVGCGTALSLLYVAKQRGRRFRVFVDETRPLLQGARLTAFELNAAGIDVTLLCDGAAASLMASGMVQVVVVGADRIAANGDVANKVGTYGLAMAAKRHGVPFYVAAPLSTFDRSLAGGREIPIEQRPEDEVRAVCGQPIAPPGTPCYNPAFDVTPADLITGIVTERGIAQPVTKDQIDKFFPPTG